MAKEVTLDKIRNKSTLFARSEENFTARSKKLAFCLRQNVGIIAGGLSG